MNKQELIDELKKLLAIPSEVQGHNYGLRRAIALTKQLDEPEKPVVPQFVADWYEEHKDNFEYSIQCLCVHGCAPARKIDVWFDNDDNKPIVTLVKMKLFGYEVEKEKLYRVELPNPNGDSNRYGLCKVDGRVIIGSFVFGLNKAVNTKLTEAEIKQDFEWAWQFAKELGE